MADEPLGSSLDDAAVLAEPVRRALYLYVARAAREVGRDEAARAARVERALAAFHLDKLVDAGLLDTSFRRLTGRSGPGAGRPAKMYRLGTKRLELSVPPRRYETLARLLARALSAGGKAHELALVARDFGRTLGAEARRLAGRSPTEARLVRAAERTLARNGFEPRRETGGVMRLANCPFEAVAGEYRELICGMNRKLLESFVDGLGTRSLSATADPKQGMCCVVLRSAHR